MTRKKLSWILAAIAVLCMAAIYSFSSQNGAATNEVSKSFIAGILSNIYQGFDNLDLGTQNGIIWGFNLFVRKCAHFSLYCTMSFMIYLFVYLRKDRHIQALGASLLIGGAFAALDELHQKFVPGRTPLVKDVFVDIAGCLVGAVICFMIISSVCMIVQRLRNRKQ